MVVLRLTYVGLFELAADKRHPFEVGQVLELRLSEGPRKIIGRVKGGGVDLFVPHGSVGREVVRLWLEGGVVWVDDLGSGNGSRLDGVERPKRARLREGSSLWIGAVMFRVGFAPREDEPLPPGASAGSPPS